MLLKKVVVDAILLKDNRIALVRRSMAEDEAGKWSFPGGGVCRGETKKEGLIRELKEELSITPDQLAISASYFSKITSANKVDSYYYICNIVGDIKNMNSEISECKWFHIDENLLTLDLAFDQKTIAKQFLDFWLKQK